MHKFLPYAIALMLMPYHASAEILMNFHSLFEDCSVLETNKELKKNIPKYESSVISCYEDATKSLYQEIDDLIKDIEMEFYYSGNLRVSNNHWYKYVGEWCRPVHNNFQSKLDSYICQMSHIEERLTEIDVMYCDFERCDYLRNKI